MFSLQPLVIKNLLNSLISIKLKCQKTLYKDAKNKFIITYINKLSNNYVVICKANYKYLLKGSINSNKIKKKTTPKNIVVINRYAFKYHKFLH